MQPALVSWTDDLHAGRHARVGTMLAKDSVRTRLESETGISFTEFSYQLLQGQDFVHLRKTHGVRVQVGGLGGRVLCCSFVHQYVRCALVEVHGVSELGTCWG